MLRITDVASKRLIYKALINDHVSVFSVKFDSRYGSRLVTVNSDYVIYKEHFNW